MSNIRTCLSAFGASLGGYLLLAGSLTATEWAAAIPVSVSIAAFATILRMRRDRVIALHVPPAAVLSASAWALAADSVRVGVVLLRAVAGRRPGGHASWQAFHPGGGSPADAGRRALVAMLTSVAPNGFVLDLRPSALPEADQGLLLHRLAPAPSLSGRDWPA